MRPAHCTRRNERDFHSARYQGITREMGMCNMQRRGRCRLPTWTNEFREAALPSSSWADWKAQSLQAPIVCKPLCIHHDPTHTFNLSPQARMPPSSTSPEAATAHSFNKILNQYKSSSKHRHASDVEESIKKLRRLILVDGIPSAVVRGAMNALSVLLTK